MRKVLFQKWIPGVETEEYKNSKEPMKQYGSTLIRWKQGTQCLSDFIYEGLFHAFIYNAGAHGETLAQIESNGELFEIEAYRMKFIDPPEATPIDWEQRRFEAACSAMQGLLQGIHSNKGAATALLSESKKNHIGLEEAIAIMVVEYADTLIKQLKNTPMPIKQEEK